MTQRGRRRNEGDTDAAALAAGGLAIVLATYMDEGRYDLFGAVVSLTLFWTLLAYLLGKERSCGERIALAAVAGLVAVPAVGFVIELAQAANRSSFFSWCKPSQTVKRLEEIDLASTVGDVPTVIGWVVIGGIVGVLDLCWFRRAERRNRARRERGSDGDGDTDRDRHEERH